MSHWTTRAHDLYRYHAEQATQVMTMIDTATAPTSAQERRHQGLIGQRSAEGDEARLRGIPAIGRNVAGAIPGTSPHTIR